MTYLRPDKKGLGLDAPGPDEPSSFAGRADARRRPWWVLGGNFVGSIVFCVVWTGYAVTRLVANVSKSDATGTDWLLFVLVSLLALGVVPSVVFFARSRHRGAAASSVERRPTPGGD